MTLEPLRLADVEAPIEPVMFPDGSTYPVLPMDAATAQLAPSLALLKGEPWYDRMFELVQRVCPEAPMESIRKLTLAQLDCIIALSSRQHEKVETYLGKSPGVEAEASTSETPSATPSPALPKPSAGGRRKSGAVPIG